MVLLSVGACSGTVRPAAGPVPTTAAETVGTATATTAPVPLPTTMPPYVPPTPPTLPPTPSAFRPLVPDGWAVPHVITAWPGSSSFAHAAFVTTDADGRIRLLEVFPAQGPRIEGAGTADDDRFGPYPGHLRYGAVAGDGTDRFDWGIAEVRVPACGVIAVASLSVDEPTLRASAATAGCRAGAGTDITPPPGFRRVPAVASGDARQVEVDMVDREDPRRSAAVVLLRASYLDVAALAGTKAVGPPITLGGRRAWWNLFEPAPTDPTTVSDWQATVDIGAGRAAVLLVRNLTRPEVDALVQRIARGFDGAMPVPDDAGGHVLFGPPTDDARVAVVTAGDRPVMQWTDADGGSVWAAVVPSPAASATGATAPVLAQVDVFGTTVDIDTSRGTWTTTVPTADGHWLWLATSGLTPARVRAVLGGLHAVDDATWAAFTADHPAVALDPG